MNHSREGDFHHSKLCQAPSLFSSYKEACYDMAKLYKIIWRKYGLFVFFLYMWIESVATTDKSYNINMVLIWHKKFYN